MGTVYTNITLRNAGDVVNVQRGLIAEKEVRELSLRALVDTGAGTLVISEEVMQRLGLGVRSLRRASIANNTKELCKVTEPVEVHWKDRWTACPALVLPNATEALLGAIPLEDMDLMVNPAKGELEGAHGDEVITLIV
jgi:clan AA aspartic protease